MSVLDPAQSQPGSTPTPACPALSLEDAPRRGQTQPKRTGGERAGTGPPHRNPEVMAVPQVRETRTGSQNSAAEPSPPAPQCTDTCGRSPGDLSSHPCGPDFWDDESRIPERPGALHGHTGCWPFTRPTSRASTGQGRLPHTPARARPKHARGAGRRRLVHAVWSASPAEQVLSWVCCKTRPPLSLREATDREQEAGPSEGQRRAGGRPAAQGAGRVEGGHSGPGCKGQARELRPFCPCALRVWARPGRPLPGTGGKHPGVWRPGIFQTV